MQSLDYVPLTSVTRTAKAIEIIATCQTNWQTKLPDKLADKTARQNCQTNWQTKLPDKTVRQTARQNCQTKLTDKTCQTKLPDKLPDKTVR